MSIIIPVLAHWTLCAPPSSRYWICLWGRKRCHLDSQQLSSLVDTHLLYLPLFVSRGRKKTAGGERKTPPFPTRQTDRQAKKALEQRERPEEMHSSTDREQSRSAKKWERSRWRRKGGWSTHSARGEWWIKEHVRACWEARLCQTHRLQTHEGKEEDEREGACVHGRKRVHWEHIWQRASTVNTSEVDYNFKANFLISTLSCLASKNVPTIPESSSVQVSHTSLSLTNCFALSLQTSHSSRDKKKKKESQTLCLLDSMRNCDSQGGNEGEGGREEWSPERRREERHTTAARKKCFSLMLWFL